MEWREGKQTTHDAPSAEHGPRRETRELVEMTDRVIDRLQQEVHDAYDIVTDESCYEQLAEMLSRDVADIPDVLKPYAGENVEAIPEDLVETFRERMRLPFHSLEHTQRVVADTEKILQAMWLGGEQISEKDFQVGRMIAAGHDVFLRWTIEYDAEKGIMRRVPLRVKSEWESANHILDCMEDVGITVDDELEAMVFEGLDATVVQWDQKHSTVRQTLLFSDSSPIARALALADIGQAGMDPEGFLKTGDDLFREEHIDLIEMTPDLLDDADWEGVKERMLKWARLQEHFARGRKALFEKEIAGLDEAVKKEVTALFQHFDTTIEQCVERLQRREQMTPQELYEDMGYELD